MKHSIYEGNHPLKEGYVRTKQGPGLTQEPGTNKAKLNSGSESGCEPFLLIFSQMFFIFKVQSEPFLVLKPTEIDVCVGIN